MLKLKIFDVYINKNLIQSIKIKDMGKIVFVKEGVSLAYFAIFYNIIYALRRGFKTFALLLFISQALLMFIANNIPMFYGLLLYTSFSLFIGNLAGDIERFFLKMFKMQKITEIVAKNIADAQDKFFVQFYPEYLNFLQEKQNKFFGKDNNYYQPDKEQVLMVKSFGGFVGFAKNKYKKFLKTIKDLKNIKVGVFKGRR